MIASFSIGSDAIYLVAAVPLLVAVVVAVAVWRSAKRERIVRTLKAHLISRDPDVRRRALDATTDQMLSTHADVYCDLLGRESDPEVLDALAAAVARSRWEPSDDAALVELRRWVAGGHARATRSSTGPSRAPARTPDAEVAPEPEVVAVAAVIANQVDEPVDAQVGADSDGHVEATPDARVDQLDDHRDHEDGDTATPLAVAPVLAAPDEGAVPADEHEGPAVVADQPPPEAPQPPQPAVAGPERVAAASAVAVAAAPAPAARRGAEPSDAELDELVPRVRELLGDVERLELVSIDGEVLKRWSSTQDAAVDRHTEGVDAAS